MGKAKAESVRLHGKHDKRDYDHVQSVPKYQLYFVPRLKNSNPLLLIRSMANMPNPYLLLNDEYLNSTVSHSGRQMTNKSILESSSLLCATGVSCVCVVHYPQHWRSCVCGQTHIDHRTLCQPLISLQYKPPSIPPSLPCGGSLEPVHPFLSVSIHPSIRPSAPSSLSLSLSFTCLPELHPSGR